MVCSCEAMKLSMLHHTDRNCDQIMYVQDAFGTVGMSCAKSRHHCLQRLACCMALLAPCCLHQMRSVKLKWCIADKWDHSQATAQLPRSELQQTLAANALPRIH